MDMGNTVVFGVIFLDVKGFPFGKYIPRGRNLGSVMLTDGGVTRNVAVNLLNIGIPVTYVTMIDDDAMGAEALERLKQAGADMRCHARTHGMGMGMWLAVFDEGGELCGSISKMPDTQPLEELIDANGDALIAEAENVVLEIDLNENIAQKVLTLAEKHGKNVYSVVGNMSVILRNPEFLRKTACFICNEIEAGKLFGEDLEGVSPETALSRVIPAARRMGLHAVVVTMGAGGAVYFDAHTGESGTQKAVASNVVDSTGAGDAFFAGTVAALTKGMPLSTAVQYGTELAHLTIETAQSACPRALLDAWPKARSDGETKTV